MGDVLHLFGVISYGTSTVCFLILTVLLSTRLAGRIHGMLLPACVVTFVWSLVFCVAALIQLSFENTWVLQILEIAHQSAWVLFLYLFIIQARPDRETLYVVYVQWVYYGLVAFLLTLFALAAWLPAEQLLTWRYAAHLVGSIVGLILVEQLYRNLKPDSRWTLKFLSIGIGGLMTYEFFLYSDALLFSRLDQDLQNARGLIHAMVALLIAFSAMRHPKWMRDIFVSRGVVFHGAAILGAALYLFAMSAGAYYIRIYGGTWGHAVQAVFLFGSLLLLLSLIASGDLRDRLRVFISKHFFQYRYDYREEWTRFIEAVNVEEKDSDKLREIAIAALARIVSSPSGLYLALEGGQFRPKVHWKLWRKDSLEAIDWEEPMVAFIRDNRWIIDLQEWRQYPERYQNMRPPRTVIEQSWPWLIIPLFEKKLMGLIILSSPKHLRELNWEDRDLLKIAAFQTASYLHLLDVTEALSQAKQFQAFNQLSAFVIHDLKNLIAQLTLVVANAKRYMDNPHFMKDAIATVENSVLRMNRLLAQLRQRGLEETQAQKIDLINWLRELTVNGNGRKPVPEFRAQLKGTALVMADGLKLKRALGHLIQNAQEATGDDGQVSVRVWQQKDKVWVEIADNGCGMDEAFVQNRLFKPFDTTKGLTGMGIGAYESKEYLEAIGGRLTVDSHPGEGTRFQICLPVAS